MTHFTNKGKSEKAAARTGMQVRPAGAGTRGRARAGLRAFGAQPGGSGAAARWLLPALVWLAIWHAASVLGGSGLLLPGPLDAAAALWRIAGEKKFYLDVLSTIGRCVFAMLLSFAAGALLSWCAYKNAAVRSLLALPVAFFKAVPVMAIIIYVILLAASDWVAVIVCFLMCFPVVYTNLLTGLDAAAASYLELAEICGLSGAQRLRLLYVPGLLPQIRASVSLISGLSWKAVVAAEVLSIPRYSLGYEMLNAKYYLETADLFAYIVVIVALSLAFERGIKAALVHLEWRPYRGSRIAGQAAAADPDCAFASAAAGRTAAAKMAGQPAMERLTADAPAVGGEPNAADPNGMLAAAEPGTAAAEGRAASSAEAEAPEVLLQGVCKAFDGALVLDDLTMRFPAGQVTALMGPSGEGKTTLARLIAGLELADGGTIFISGQTEKPAVLFQEDRLLPWLNVYDNLAMAMAAGTRKEAEIDRAVRQMARQLELEEALYALPAQLSGGMRSRAALGRTFLMKRRLLILDEPFQGLDAALKTRIIERLWLHETAGRTVILVTHSAEDAARLAAQTLSVAGKRAFRRAEKHEERASGQEAGKGEGA